MEPTPDGLPAPDPTSPDTALVEVIEGKRPPKERPVKERLLSLDAFRGLTILLMLLVNNIALDTFTPEQLMHAEWNGGVHAADLVFPWFLLCVGIAIPFSVASSRAKGIAAWRLDMRIVTRAALLVFMGCVIESSIARHPMFSLGVLQLIGLAYLVGAFLYDLGLFRRVLVTLGILALYAAALRYVPFPGGPAFEEGTNLVAHLNRLYLEPFGLSGLPGLLPTAALVLIGTMVGDLLRSDRFDAGRKAGGLALVGVALTAIGMVANLHLPYNKPVWTPSYILLSAGLGCTTLLFFYLLIDLSGWKKWPYVLVVFGSNPIVAYFVPIVLKLWVLQVWHVRGVDGQPINLQDGFLQWCVTHLGRIPGGWAYTVAYIAVWWLVLWALYRKRVFLRV